MYWLPGLDVCVEQCVPGFNPGFAQPITRSCTTIFYNFGWMALALPMFGERIPGTVMVVLQPLSAQSAMGT